MIRRTTVELDEDLVNRAKAALGCPTTRATIEEALRRAAESAENDRAQRATRQREYFDRLGEHLDLEVLRSRSMWR